MEQFQFNFKDIFRFTRYAFSGRRIGIHLVGILLAYLVYEILFYLSLLIVDSADVNKYWKTFGLIPVPPFGAVQFNSLTTTVLWIGLVLFAILFFLSSTMASKITIEQFRGDLYFSVGDAFRFLRNHWITVLGTFLGLLFILAFLFFIPISVGLLGKIPIIGDTILVLSSLFLPIAFIFGLLIVYISVVFITSLFLVPAIVASTDADAFETIYQLFAVLWNQPWRLIGYSTLLFIIKLLLVPVWAIFCLIGFIVALMPLNYLHSDIMHESFGNANLWLGESLQKISSFFYVDSSTLFGIKISQVPIFTTSATIIGLLIAITIISIVCVIIAFLFSIASVGTTLIYTIIRKKIDGLNLVETVRKAVPTEPPPLLIGDE